MDLSYNCTMGSQGHSCKVSSKCRRCGFEATEAAKRSELPFHDALVDVPFTDEETGETTYETFKVMRRRIPHEWKQVD